VVSSPGGTTDLQTANSFGDKSDLFVGEDTDKGGNLLFFAVEKK
jgi:hypothetical protein